MGNMNFVLSLCLGCGLEQQREPSLSLKSSSIAPAATSSCALALHIKQDHFASFFLYFLCLLLRKADEVELTEEGCFGISANVPGHVSIWFAEWGSHLPLPQVTVSVLPHFQAAQEVRHSYRAWWSGCWWTLLAEDWRCLNVMYCSRGLENLHLENAVVGNAFWWWDQFSCSTTALCGTSWLI